MAHAAAESRTGLAPLSLVTAAVWLEPVPGAAAAELARRGPSRGEAQQPLPGPAAADEQLGMAERMPAEGVIGADEAAQLPDSGAESSADEP